MWWILLTILLFVLTLFLFMLTATIALEINTTKGLYLVRFGRLAYGRFYLADYEPWVEVKIAWWKRQYSLLKMPQQKSSTANKPQPEKPKRKKQKLKLKLSTVKALLRSFKIEKFNCSLDTGDYVLNGQLYPAFCWYKWKTGHNAVINFQGNNYLELVVKNSGWRILKAILYNQ